jgi:glyoxylate/hydroxypyruvate reductase A
MNVLPEPGAATVGAAKPVIVFYSQYDEPAAWRPLFERHCPGWAFQVWPDVAEPDAVEVALVWKPPPGMLTAFPRLRLIINLGAGVDAILGDPNRPASVPVVRLNDPGMAIMMMQYVLYCALHYHRNFPEFAQAQKQRRWHYIHPRPTRHTHIGLLGLGMLGSFVAMELSRQGFTVSGWARTPKQIDGIVTTHGAHPAHEWLGTLDILVILLPLTPQTRGLVDRTVLQALPRGVKLVSVGRGAVVNEADLIEALRDGHVGAATVDTCEQEPLPPEHPFWAMENVILTPHLASVAVPESCMAQIVRDIGAVHAGKRPARVVDPAAGY